MMTDVELNVLGTWEGISRTTRPMKPSTDKGQPRCQGESREPGSWPRWYQCDKRGVLLEPAPERSHGREEGVLYHFCRTHAPSKVKERDEARTARHAAESRAHQVKWAQEVATRAILRALESDDMDAVRAAYAQYKAAGEAGAGGDEVRE